MSCSYIKGELEARFQPELLEIVDESFMHTGHPGVLTGGGHYRVLIVAEAFTGVSLVDRHRMIYQCLSMGENSTIHALSITALTPEEHAQRSS